MTISRDQIAERVRAGVSLLNYRLPDWQDRIDRNTLHMESSYHCVLSQISSANFTAGKTMLGLHEDDLNNAGDYGFDIPTSEAAVMDPEDAGEYWSILDELWQEELT